MMVFCLIKIAALIFSDIFLDVVFAHANSQTCVLFFKMVWQPIVYWVNLTLCTSFYFRSQNSMTCSLS